MTYSNGKKLIHFLAAYYVYVPTSWLNIFDEH